MYNNWTVIEQVLILFIIIAIGILAKKRKVLNAQVISGMTELILDVTLPLMIISSFNQAFSWDKLINASWLLVFSSIIHGVSYIVSKYLYYKYPDDKKSVLRYATVFSNAAFMGYPVLQALYGDMGIFYASVYTIPFRIFMWSLGVALFTKASGKGSLKKILLNPPIIAVAVGLVIFLTPFKFPSLISKTFNLVGSITTPLSMIVIGALLADMKIRDIFSDFAVFYGSFVRLIALPVVVLFSFRAFGVNKILLDIMVILTAMPAGSMTAILAERYKANASFASRCVFVSTIFSVLTIPLMIMLL